MKVKVAATQMACSWELEDNINKAKNIIKNAANQGANIILLQELFQTPYFCIEYDENIFRLAKEFENNPLLKEMADLAKQLNVVLPICYFEKTNNVYFNSIGIINSDGSIKFSHPVKDAFFELNDYLSKDLIQVKNDNESILSIGDSMNFITAGFVSEDNIQSFKIIVNYEGKILDKVFEFSSLNYNKILEMMSCSMKMLDK